jgi:uncharacterized protein (DUF924 family)
MYQQGEGFVPRRRGSQALRQRGRAGSVKLCVRAQWHSFPLILLGSSVAERKAQMSKITPAEVVSFWREAGPQRWFQKDEDFDLTIKARFLAIHEAAARGEFAAFEESADGALALVILFDQFPRYMFRDSARAFATDPLARAVAHRALARGFDQATDETMRPFFYLPFMHSELLADQDRCVRLFEELGNADQAKYAAHHRDIVVKFRRFPHRNRVMGRDTTPAEQEFLNSGGFTG